jgi:AraC family transcriptional regulator
MNQLSAIRPLGDGLEVSVAQALSKLLSDAGDLVDRDRSAAKSCIDRALALVEIETGRRHAGGTPPPAQEIGRALAPWQAKRVVAFIDANLDRAIQVSELADLTRLTAGYFSRAFCGSFGLAPRSYITQRRIELACHLMLTTDEPLSRIALECGLADQAHFSRVFSRALGSPPGLWRRARRGSTFSPRK